MDYRPLSQGTQRQFLGVLKQLPLVTNLFTITCAVNSERERETEREREGTALSGGHFSTKVDISDSLVWGEFCSVIPQ